MSGQTVEAFLAYWEQEGQAYVRRGDYAWMASLVRGQRVLEIGCGPGFGTAALVAAGKSVMSIDTLDSCLAAAKQRVPGEALSLLKADVALLDPAERQQIAQFGPDTIVCWLMGAPSDVTGASTFDGGAAVAAYRERVHRAVAVLAADLAGVSALHFVDRTAIAWQAKDIGRDTLVKYHLEKTLHGLPFTASREAALYRKLGDAPSPIAGRVSPAMRGVVPTLASLMAERK